jgi:hypothetical protein
VAGQILEEERAAQARECKKQKELRGIEKKEAWSDLES